MLAVSREVGNKVSAIAAVFQAQSFPCDSARFEPVSHTLACREHSRQAGDSELSNAFFLSGSNRDLCDRVGKAVAFLRET